MDQTAAQTALVPFLALAKSATSTRAASDLVTQATSANGTFVFGELLAQKNIDALKNDDQYSSYHALLEIFAWGTWETYVAAKDLPQLNSAQTLKLRLLSLISYAAEKHGDFSYTTLCKRLGLETAIDLEHLITTAVYTDLITATLDPAEQTVLITSVAPLRDLVPGSVKSMLADLEAWSSRCDAVLAGLEKEIAKVKTDAAERAAREASADKQVKLAEELSEKNTSSSVSSSSIQRNPGRGQATTRMSNSEEAEQDGGNADDDPMDIDGQSSRKKSGTILDKLRGR